MLGFTISIDADGIVTLGFGGGKTWDLTWTTTDIRDEMRFTANFSGVTSDQAADRTHLRGVYPDRTAILDLPSESVQAGQSLSDTGQTETVWYAHRVGWRLRLHADGQPYDTAYNEYHALRSFFVDHATKGYRFRYYRDTDEERPYAEKTAPSGFQVFTLDAGDFFWSPVPQQDNWYQHWERDLTCWPNTGT